MFTLAVRRKRDRRSPTTCYPMIFSSVVSHIVFLAVPQKPQSSITVAFRHVEETHAKTINKIMTFKFFPGLSVVEMLCCVIPYESQIIIIN